MGQVIVMYQYQEDGWILFFIKFYWMVFFSQKDLIVVDYISFYIGRLCVLNEDGCFRFIYEGKSGKKDFKFNGVCCDMESYILVVDSVSYVIYILDQDGKFFCYLIIKKEGFVYFFFIVIFRDVFWIGGYYGFVKIFKVKYIK